MRVLLVGEARSLSDAVAETMPGAVTTCEETFAGAMAALDTRPGLLITSDRVGRPGDTGSGLDLARSARARKVPCILVSEVWHDGAYGAVPLTWGGDVAAAVRAALG